MRNENWMSLEEKLEEINKNVIRWSEKVNAELLKLNKSKEVLLDWDKWFKKGKDRVCGVQFGYYLTLYPNESNECVRACAEALTNFWKYKRVGEVKDALSNVFDELIRKQRAVGGPIGFGSLYFWIRLQVLVWEVIFKPLPIKSEPYVEDSYIDEKTGEQIAETIINLDIQKEENNRIEAIDERLWLESLKENEKVVHRHYLDGYSEQEIEDKTGIGKSKVHRIIQSLTKKYETWKKG